jgi:pimeloyl-ACP methyl ester carboxylesterase
MKTPFIIHIEDSVIADLKKRIAATRWTDEVQNEKWEYGTNKRWLQSLCDYWQEGFDWRKQEEYLNSFNHFKAEIDGTELHFIHQPGIGKNAVPLLLTHGYPDSFARFLKIIPLLTKEDENGLSFDLVIPSVPGYGFSAKPTEPGMDPKRIAHLFTKLMTKELGYEKFLAHGGDWGTSITEQIALYHSDTLLGIHLTDVPFSHLFSIPKGELSKSEKDYLERGQHWQQTQGAYAMIQSTKPQTLGYALNDSPAGLAAWISQSFYSWSDHDGNIENAFSKDELLTNLTIYWATQTINSAIRIYYEAMKTIMNAKYNPLVKFNPFDRTGKKPEVPAAFALFPKDLVNAPKDFAERIFNVQQWTEMPEGGHFAAMEQPVLLSNDIRNFVSALDKDEQNNQNKKDEMVIF